MIAVAMSHCQFELSATYLELPALVLEATRHMNQKSMDLAAFVSGLQTLACDVPRHKSQKWRMPSDHAVLALALALILGAPRHMNQKSRMSLDQAASSWGQPALAWGVPLHKSQISRMSLDQAVLALALPALVWEAQRRMNQK